MKNCCIFIDGPKDTKKMVIAMGGQVADHVPEANFYVGSPQGTEYKVRFFSYEVAG